MGCFMLIFRLFRVYCNLFLYNVNALVFMLHFAQKTVCFFISVLPTCNFCYNIPLQHLISFKMICGQVFSWKPYRYNGFFPITNKCNLPFGQQYCPAVLYLQFESALLSAQLKVLYSLKNQPAVKRFQQLLLFIHMIGASIPCIKNRF